MASKRTVAIVTGASSGIGAATARLFAGRNYAVSLAGRNIDRLDNVARQCREAAGREHSVLSTSGDIVDDGHLESLVRRTVDKYGRIDVLVNNAGAVLESYDPAQPNGIDVFDKTIDVNIRSVIKLTRRCEPHIIEAKGNIVNVSSIGAKLAIAGDAFYAMSKAAMDIYTQALALRMAPLGVRANVVSPGAVDTPIFDTIEGHGMDREALGQLMSLSHPVGRMGRSEEVAELIAFLADNNKAAFITGTVFNIDGGCSASNAFNAVMSMQPQQ